MLGPRLDEPRTSDRRARGVASTSHAGPIVPTAGSIGPDRVASRKETSRVDKPRRIASWVREDRDADHAPAGPGTGPSAATASPAGTTTTGRGQTPLAARPPGA